MTYIAHLADLHLGYRQYGLIEREEDIYETFDEAVDKIIEEHARIVIIAGDLFNSARPPIRSLYHVKSNLEKLKSRGINVFCILGDHDIPRRVGEYSPLTLFRGDLLHHIDGKTVEIEIDGIRIKITGVDRAPSTASDKVRKIIEKLSKDIQTKAGTERNILVTHLPLHGISGELCIDDLPENYDYYALGHEHVRRVFRKGLGLASYPGSIDILSRDEIIGWKLEGKGFYLVDLSGSEPIVEKVDLKSIRPQEIFEISLGEPIDKLVDWITHQSKKPILHLLIKDREFDLRRINEIAEKLRGIGCLDVRYRRKIFREDDQFKALPHIDHSRFNIIDLIKTSIMEIGLSEEEAELAINIYKEFRTGGGDALKELLLRRSPEG
ncbi:MAG: exonuclease SbcCD subunit D [Candidatus Caldarchaeales archaeon]